MGRQSVRLEREKLYRWGERWPQYLRGFGGINTSGVDRQMDPWQALYMLNLSTRVGLYGSNFGVLSTRPGFARACKYNLPGFAGDVATNYPVRALHKWYPSQEVTSNGEMIRIELGNFEVNNGSGWTLKNADNLFVNTTARPQMIEAGWPNKHMFIAMPGTLGSPGGLYCYDNNGNFWKQAVPRYGGAGDINSLRWLCVGGDGRLYGCGDYIDADMPLAVVYSAPANAGVYTAPNDTSMFEYPNGGVFLVYAQGPANTSGPTRITGIAWMQGYIVIFTESGRYVVSNAGTGNEYIDYMPGYGCLSGKLITEDPRGGKIYWWDAYGGYSWSGAGQPTRLTDPIWSLLSALRAVDGGGSYLFPYYFSFFYLDQWWTCVRLDQLPGITASSTPGTKGYDLNANFVLDMKTGQWHLYDIPMTDVAICTGGLDLGQMYFSSPVDTLGSPSQYWTYSYGYDEQTGKLVYDDDGSNILAIWKSTKLAGKDYLRRKRYEKFRLSAGVTAGTTPIGAALNFYVNGAGPYPLTWANDPNADVVFDRGLNHRYGNYIEFDLRVTSKRQSTLYAAEYTYEEVMTDG
jgi:hypothetical protein